MINVALDRQQDVGFGNRYDRGTVHYK